MRSDLRTSPPPLVARPTPDDFWHLYDRLGADLEPTLCVRHFYAGLNWFAVQADGAIGMAMSPREGHAAPSISGRIAGMPLAEIAPLAKSWNLADAALGVAALNAYHNHADRIRDWVNRLGDSAHEANAFEYFRPRLAGKRVAVIGHFHCLEGLAETCELTILERRPQAGDLPDPACEVVLPRSDFVFITATTLINKTLPRLLTLSRNAFVVIVGPTTPLSPVWFDLGVQAIAGLCLGDAPTSWRTLQEGGRLESIARGGRLVLVERR
jgi:hypothetical protein